MIQSCGQSSDALELAIKETRNITATPVTVFTDLRAALIKIQKKASAPEGLAVRDLVHQKPKELTTNGHSVTLRWVPGHSKVEGNERANCAAKRAAERGGIETDCWSSLTHVKTELKRTRWAELSAWHQKKAQEREASRRGFYISQAKCGINSTLGEAPKKYAARYYQLKTGHGAIGTFFRSSFVNGPAVNQDFIHSKAWIVSGFKEIVCFVPENTRSDSDDMAGRENISVAMADNRGNRVCGAGSIHQETIERSSRRPGFAEYRSNLLRLLSGCASLFAIQDIKCFSVWKATSIRSSRYTNPVDER